MANFVRAVALGSLIAAAIAITQHQPGWLLVCGLLAAIGGGTIAARGGQRPIIPGGGNLAEIRAEIRAEGRSVLRRLLHPRQVPAPQQPSTVRGWVSRIPSPRRVLGGLIRFRQLGPAEPDAGGPNAGGRDQDDDTGRDTSTQTGGSVEGGRGREPIAPPAPAGPGLDWRGRPVGDLPSATPPDGHWHPVIGPDGRSWVDPDGNPLTDSQAQELWRSWTRQQANNAAGVLPAASQLAPAVGVGVLEPPKGIEMTNALTTTDDGQITLGHRGHASIAALIREWETSSEARQYPETFIAWLHSQFASAQQRAGVVQQCVVAYHGRGPSGHMGVPEGMLARFLAAYEAAADAEAAAFRQFAQEYAAYVDQAEHELPRQYGREVIASVGRQHRGR